MQPQHGAQAAPAAARVASRRSTAHASTRRMTALMRVGDDDQGEEGEQDRARLAAVEHLHRLVHQLAEAAGADEAHHDRGAHRALPAVDGVRRELLRGARHERVEERAQARAARLEQRARRARVARFEDLGVDLAEHAAVGDREREHAGARAEAERANEDERPDDLGDRAQHGEQRRASRCAPPAPAPRPRPGPMRETASARVATTASGTATTKASAMPAVAIASVSSVAFQSRARKSGAVAGGRKPARKFAITCRLPPSKSCHGLNSASTSSGQRTTSGDDERGQRARAPPGRAAAPAAAPSSPSRRSLAARAA